MPAAHHRHHRPTAAPLARAWCLLVIGAFALALVGGGGRPAAAQTGAPTTVPTVTRPTVTRPPVTQPPVTQPAVTQPPTTAPFVTEPATTQPPVDQSTVVTDTTLAPPTDTQPPATAAVLPPTTFHPRTTLAPSTTTTTLYLLPGIVGGVTLPARSEPQAPKPQNADMPSWAIWLFAIGVAGASAMLVGQWLGTSPKFATRANGLLRR